MDDAKKALFGSTKLKSFHFVVYGKNGPKWLLFCGEFRPDVRRDMEQWGRVFGDDFAVTYAVRRAGGIKYFSSDRTERKLGE